MSSVNWSFQPGLFDDEYADRFEKYLYVDSMNKDKLIAGSANIISEYILYSRAIGYEGDFNVWDYKLLLESYKREDKDLSGLLFPYGLEAKLMRDSDD